MLEALTNDAFSVLNDQPRYESIGVEALQAHLRAMTGRADLVAPIDVRIKGVSADSATAAEWAVVRHLQAVLPDASITLREHQLSWRLDPDLPGLTRRGARVD